MRPSSRFAVWIALSITGAHACGQNVVIELASPWSNGQIGVNQSVDWSLRVHDESSTSLGLAAFMVDVVPAPTNPAPAFLTAATTPVSMVSFVRPNGICNPLPGSTESAYGGTVIDLVGGAGLFEVGGAPNTFGAPMGGIGLDTSVETGVAQEPTGRIVAQGTFMAPATLGQYCFYLQSARAAVILSVAGQGEVTAVGAVAPVLGEPLCIEVVPGPVCDSVDFNQDGVFPDNADTLDFLAVFSGAACPSGCTNTDIDFNNDGVYPDTCDLFAYLLMFAGGPCSSCG